MKAFIRPAERTDILKVIADMSDATAHDLRKLGLGPDETLEYFARRVPERDAVTCVDGDTPLVVFGWDKWSPDGCWYSWILTSRAFFSPDPAPILVSRRYMRSVRARHPDVQLMSLLASDTEKVRRWMKLLGFERLRDSPLVLWRYAG